jgi:DNA-binding transcriptional MerR regulator
MRIGQLAKQAGVRASTIRYYERRRLLEPPWRQSRGERRYDRRRSVAWPSFAWRSPQA